MNIEMGCEVYRNRLLPINFNDVLKGAEPIFPVADAVNLGFPIGRQRGDSVGAADFVADFLHFV